jgi:hypothetical protein
MWFEIQLRQAGEPDRFPMILADSKEDVRRDVQNRYPFWQIIRIWEIPDDAQGKKEGQ